MPFTLHRLKRRFGCLRAARDVVVAVVDEGVGMDQAEIQHIFDHFYRVDKARSLESGGSGLGLSIVRKIADLHRAKIEVDSVINQGTSFRIVFPSAISDADKEYPATPWDQPVDHKPF
jgi:signal transduction histidine kinase